MALKLFLLLALVAIVIDAAPADPKEVAIVRSTNDNEGKGDYKWSYESADKSSAQAEGKLKPAIAPDSPPFLAVKGGYSYVDTDGKTVSVTYESDEFGYREMRTIT